MSFIRRPLLVLLPATALLAVLALVTNVVPFRQIVDQRNQVNEARLHLAEVEEANQRLTEQVEALDTPLAIERLARERLGLVRAGEQAFVVVDPGVQTEQLPPVNATLPPNPEQQETDGPSWAQQFWDYLTGRDLEQG